jgi:hypothetical protein
MHQEIQHAVRIMLYMQIESNADCNSVRRKGRHDRLWIPGVRADAISCSCKGDRKQKRLYLRNDGEMVGC